LDFTFKHIVHCTVSYYTINIKFKNIKNNVMKTQQKGFTLLELLIVIAILAVLATVAVLVINPVEYLRQARDSQRINDLAAVKGALDLYTSATTSPDLGACPAGAVAARCSFAGGTSPFTSVTAACGAGTVGTGVDGNTANWVDVNFASLSGGSPLPKLPVDPSNSATYFYAYACNETSMTYELDANLESVKFVGMEASDGGNAAAGWYEVGTNLAL
jgi:prepilin-type N-terminal cleavage/methylation domain-containing protein